MSLFDRVWADFDAIEMELRREANELGFRIPLLPEELETARTEEGMGEIAEGAGKLREALQRYQAALERTANRSPGEAEQRLRERIIKLVQRLDPPPAIPEEARRRAAYAMTALQEAKNEQDLDNAVAEWKQVLRVAPWWPEAYYNMALILEKGGRYAEAAQNLELYLLAAPKAEDADVVQQKIYSLEYKAKKQPEK